MDTGSRLTCLAIVSPSGLLKELTEDPLVQDPVGKESEEISSQAQTCESERIKTALIKGGKETKGKRKYKKVVLSENTCRCCSQAVESDPRAGTKKTGGVKKGLAKGTSRSRASQLGVKLKLQGKMSRRRLLLRKRYYCSLKRLGDKK